MFTLKNYFAFVILNIYAWWIGAGMCVRFCPKCGVANCFDRFGVKHCDMCGYRQGELRI